MRILKSARIACVIRVRAPSAVRGCFDVWTMDSALLSFPAIPFSVPGIPVGKQKPLAVKHWFVATETTCHLTETNHKTSQTALK